jgi:hypothetical protein
MALRQRQACRLARHETPPPDELRGSHRRRADDRIQARATARRKIAMAAESHFNEAVRHRPGDGGAGAFGQATGRPPVLTTPT